MGSVDDISFSNNSDKGYSNYDWVLASTLEPRQSQRDCRFLERSHKLTSFDLRPTGAAGLAVFRSIHMDLYPAKANNSQILALVAAGSIEGGMGAAAADPGLVCCRGR